MFLIHKASNEDSSLLSRLATQTLMESHGHSAPAADMENYIGEKYTVAVFNEELNDPKNIYHIIYHDGKPVGFSKIIFNEPYAGSPLQNITKLDRIYLLKEFYDLKLGQQLLQFNLDLAKQNDQVGMWLYVWQENERAVKFYTRNGFTVIGGYDFHVSATHSNPNYHMLLRF